MPTIGLKTATPDAYQLKLRLAVLLSDQFTNTRELKGSVSIVVTGKPQVSPYTPFRKATEGTFCFFDDLPSGGYTLHVQSDETPPIYQPVDIALSVPLSDSVVDPKWPAYPNLALANKALPLDDPAQPVLYRNQRTRTMLRPTVYYPFPADATLIRGIVLSGGVPVEKASVRHISGESSYETDKDGLYVLFVQKLAGLQAQVEVSATKAGLPPKSILATARRGETISQDIVLS